MSLFFPKGQVLDPFPKGSEKFLSRESFSCSKVNGFSAKCKQTSGFAPAYLTAEQTTTTGMDLNIFKPGSNWAPNF